MKTKFIFFLALGLVIIVESLIIVDKLQPAALISHRPVLPQLLAPIPKGILKIKLEEGQTIKPHQNLKAQINFDPSGEPVAGIDAILTFDPKAINLIKIDDNKEIFEQILINRQQKNQGRVKITAYLPKKMLQTQETLAFLTFQLLKPQRAILGIEFSGANVTSDSNLVSQMTQRDLLGQVVSLVLNPEETSKGQ